MTDEQGTPPVLGESPQPRSATPAGERTPAPLDELSSPLLGSSAPARAASRAVRALLHAASSFMLYDAGNEAVTRFLAETREAVMASLSTHGALELTIHPWQIASAGEVVFSDRDRERSMPFRLYRDGVRRLTIQPDVTWGELVELVGILAVRSKGIQQQEDDVVTLLWRASFAHIQIAAVEAMVAEDDEAEEDSGRHDDPNGPHTALQAIAWSAPYHFDIPPPPFSDRVAPAWRAIPAAVLGRIEHEDSPAALAGECRQLVAELVDLLGDPVDPLPTGDLVPLVREIRAALVAEGDLETVVEMAGICLAANTASPETGRELLAAIADPATMRAAFDRAAAEPASRPALAALLEAAPGDHLPMLLAALESRDDPTLAAYALELIAARAAKDSRPLAALLRSRPDADSALLAILERSDPDTALTIAGELLENGDESARHAALGVLERAPWGPRVGRPLVRALAAADEETRRRAMAVMIARRERRAVDPLLDRLTHHAHLHLGDEEAAAIGAALAALDPQRVAPVFRDWIKPPGLLGRLAPVAPAFRWAAVAGISSLPAAEAIQLLTWLAGRVSGALQQSCQAALAGLRGGAR